MATPSRAVVVAVCANRFMLMERFNAHEHRQDPYVPHPSVQSGIQFSPRTRTIRRQIGVRRGFGTNIPCVEDGVFSQERDLRIRSSANR